MTKNTPGDRLTETSRDLFATIFMLPPVGIADGVMKTSTKICQFDTKYMQISSTKTDAIVLITYSGPNLTITMIKSKQITSMTFGKVDIIFSAIQPATSSR